MPDNEPRFLPASRRLPWSKGRLIGAKPPLRRKRVWSIRTRLTVEELARDLAMFNLAIDSKLRDCDVWPSKSRTLPWLKRRDRWASRKPANKRLGAQRHKATSEHRTSA
jgi:hypothetical protein